MEATKESPESELLNSEQAARYLNRPVSFVRRVIRWEVPVHQYGERKPCYYRKQDLDLWVLRNTRHPVG